MVRTGEREFLRYEILASGVATDQSRQRCILWLNILNPLSSTITLRAPETNSSSLSSPSSLTSSCWNTFSARSSAMSCQSQKLSCWNSANWGNTCKLRFCQNTYEQKGMSKQTSQAQSSHRFNCTRFNFDKKHTKLKTGCATIQGTKIHKTYDAGTYKPILTNTQN